MPNEVFADYISPWPNVTYTSHEGDYIVHAAQIASYPNNWVFLYTKQRTCPVGVFRIRRRGGSYIHYELVD